MSGHSKWSTIKRQKGITDSRRSAVFTKFGRQITVAARLGGGDPDKNFRLRLAIDKARSVNLPKENIERAIKSGTGGEKGALLKEVLYEGFGPGGVAVMVEALTDNSNRTAAEIRSIFTKQGCSLGSQNSVGWMFLLRGVIRLPLPTSRDSIEALELAVIDAGADDVREDGDQLVIISPADLLASISLVLAQTSTQETDVEYLPTTTVDISDQERNKLHTLLESLDQLEDVTRVTSNEN